MGRHENQQQQQDKNLMFWNTHTKATVNNNFRANKLTRIPKHAFAHAQKWKRKKERKTERKYENT